MTAAVYMRGVMQHEFGVKPTDVEWVQGRTDRLGRKLPSDIKLTQAPAGTELGDMLERGEIDFMMTANNPLSFRRGSPKVRRLFPNYPEVEKEYYQRTKIYPIMHTVVIRKDVYENDPWVALNLYQALCRAKDACYRSITDTGIAQGVVRLAAADDRGGEAHHRRGLVSLRHREEPAVTGRAAAIHPRARPDRPADEDRGPFRAVDHARHSAERRTARLGLSAVIPGSRLRRAPE